MGSGHFNVNPHHIQSVNQPARNASENIKLESNQQNVSVHSSNLSTSAHRNENLLCAVLALIKELNESELELIKRDIEKKLMQKQQ